MMYGDLKTMKEFWKKVDTIRVAADAKLSNKPCYVFGVSILSSGSGSSIAYLRDGHDDTGDIKVDIGAPTSDRNNWSFSPPIYFKKGLYVDVVQYVTGITVQFLIEKETE